MKQPPPPPDVLDATGQTEWTRVVGLLVERGQWDPLRSTVLLAYCESYADWHRLTEQVRGKEVVLQGGTRRVDDQGHVTTEGGKAAPNPLLPVIDRAHRSLQVALEELLRPAPWALAPTPAPVADGTQAEPTHPWLRHPDETAKAYAAFRYYRDLGEQRAAMKVWEKYGLSRGLVERWSTLHAWVIRVRAWDEHQDRIAVAVSTDAIQAIRLEHAGWGHVAAVAAIETINARMHGWRDRGAVGEPPFTAFEAARLRGNEGETPTRRATSPGNQRTDAGSRAPADPPRQHDAQGRDRAPGPRPDRQSSDTGVSRTTLYSFMRTRWLKPSSSCVFLHESGRYPSWTNVFL